MKNFSIIFLLMLYLIPTLQCLASNYGVKTYQNIKIDASNNARHHNNLGNLYFQEKNYTAALKEYELAYNLAHTNNLSATYLYNIARCFMTLNHYELAKNALLGVIKKDCMNITYYQALVDCFINLNTQNYELETYSKDNTNPYNKIIVGLIYSRVGNKQKAKKIFNSFIKQNPDLLIVDDVKNLLNNL